MKGNAMANVKIADWATDKKERLSYYSYFLGQNAIYTMVTNFLTTYLLFQGLDPAKSGLVMLAVKVWDAVNDTIFGVIFDAVKFKSGKKYLPWLKVSTFFIPITTVLIYMIPRSSGETVKLIWFAVAYILWDTAYTLCDVPIYGIVTAMTERIDERTSLLSFKSIWGGLGGAVALVLGTVLVGEKVGLNFGVAAIAVSLIAFLTMLPVNYKVKERFNPETDEEFTIRRMFKYLFGNKYLLIYYFGFFIQGSLAVGPPLALFVSYYMFNNSQFSLIILALTVFPMLLAALFVPRILNHIDKMKLYLI
ncbi:MAG TPA: MFS transporter, partial [Oscillospiraceae bacterium]|nr:MFS transporter [Oscillospiraceae bacterium]